MAQHTKRDDMYRGDGEAVAAALGAFLGRLRVRPHAPLHARASTMRLGTIAATRLTSSPFTIVWERDSHESQRKLLFVFVETGVVELRGESTRRTTDNAGLCVVAPGSAPVIIEAVTETRMVLFALDRSDIAPLTLDEQALEDNAGASPIYHAAFAYLCGIIQLPAEPDPIEAHALRELTRDVARSLVRAFSANGAMNTTLRARAHRVMEEVYRRREISVNDVARQLGVSRRTLERAFSASSGSVAETLREIRARHALATMREHPDRILREIAEESGFGSVDSLRRAVEIYYSAPLARLRASPAEEG